VSLIDHFLQFGGRWLCSCFELPLKKADGSLSQKEHRNRENERKEGNLPSALISCSREFQNSQPYFGLSQQCAEGSG
jgi:hypothetical protein